MAGSDEIDPPELHVWLCACRLLMLELPIQGAWLDCPSFAGSCRPVPGWNKEVFEDGRPPNYIFFDLAARHADRKPFLPEGVDETSLNVLRPKSLTDASHSPLWTRASIIASTLKTGSLPQRFGEPKATMAIIARYLTLAKKSEEISAVSAPIMETIFKGIDFGKPTGPDPALRIASQFMNFLIPGVVARYLLSSTYEALYLTSPGLFKRRFASVDTMLMQKAEDLSDAAYRLYRARTELDVAGFFNATYLATLCAATVITMASNDGGRLERLQFTQDERDRLRRLRQNADELQAHYLTPAFELPAKLQAKDIISWVHAVAPLRRQSPQEIAEEQCLHPGLTAVLNALPLDEIENADLHALYMSNVSTRPTLTI